MKVFLVDDSTVVRDRVAAVLKDLAMTIVGSAETPEDAIHGILTTHPDVVVLDVQLQGGGGLDVLRAVRRTRPDIVFVVFTNYADPACRALYLSSGAQRYLDKTTQFDQLAIEVGRLASSVAH
jgi:DNA-binding NarL/FixJ family response regulator